MIDALLKPGLPNATDVVVSYDDTAKKVTVRCGKGTVLELRGDKARMFGYLNNMVIRASDKKFHPCLTRNWKSIFLCFFRYHQEPIS